MLDFPGGYKIVTAKDKTGIIETDHKKKELLISKDINLKTTDDGKLCATFPNNKSNKLSSLLGLNKNSDTGCSITISNPECFNYCVKKDDTYQLSGSDVTFNGTNQDDKLILKDVNNSKINMGNGNDNVSIKGKSNQSYFLNNIINTGNGNDNVDISGNFKKFHNNQFYLGKGSDNFSATINPDDDVQTKSEFESKIPKYGATVSKNEIYAIDGYTKDGDKKGWFENNVFESKTYSANQLFKYNPINSSISGADGFQTYKFKPEPQNPSIVSTKGETSQVKSENQTTVAAEKGKDQSSKKLTSEDYIRKYQACSMGAMLFNDANMQNAAFEALDNLVNSWTK